MCFALFKVTQNLFNFLETDAFWKVQNEKNIVWQIFLCLKGYPNDSQQMEEEEE